ncbi:N-acetylglucosaminyl-phosphatidylinositol biosynthetic protein [Naegleria gruberi]|uniref:phosphatidylinositol N-acetylglucosaminyltransferase n=1 Tax=Naegleria gruberi TaxID=5762 RepID=D2UYZ3_NAEGR|nr:N-acetylglucosaminyl-phosphatidylinositol biosynthetic protein [Naegleria gruberi]EFC49860.1 N-acetylglucosaminyl-phosphatidylinositol biosynthetic protein [Naegleria gruberi]|eukprot:XP_002682604.1 N-acetylglucosaminyl-phosphatidylinositol biosynthetic protein [Naegleria gruberi strain NEG-M]
MKIILITMYIHLVTTTTDGSGNEQKLRICMISDFFYPGFGGVESHIYCISTGLIKRGHKVIVITTSYDDRKGVRYLTNGIKVYYIPVFKINTSAGSATLPFIFTSLPLLRNILIRERIEIVHGHQCTSNVCNEGLLHARTMGLKCFFTDHSLFGFGDEGGVHINKVSRFVLSEVDHVICVSHTLKENLTLRASLNPFKTTVIPHAVDTNVFKPLRTHPPRRDERLKIVSTSRLVYRKGADLLISIIPVICTKYPHVDFIIAGDGPNLIEMTEMIERYELFDRVELLGAKPYHEIPSVLQRGHLFLNTSLTEAFCMAILEAASCGLFAVSTNVGGVREVLPDNDMVLLANPDPLSLCEAMEKAIECHVYNTDPIQTHERVCEMYNWDKVVACTEALYVESMHTCKERGLLETITSYNSVGFFHGKIIGLLTTLDYLFYQALEYMYPREEIDVCPEFGPFYLKDVND